MKGYTMNENRPIVDEIAEAFDTIRKAADECEAVRYGLRNIARESSVVAGYASIMDGVCALLSDALNELDEVC